VTTIPPAMSTVHLSFTPDPAYVRTVRLVAAAVARRAGVADELLDEVRLAIGEACTRAVALHRRHELTDLIDVSMSDGGRFTVRVIDRGPISSAAAPGQITTDVMAQVAAEAGGRAAVEEDVIMAGVGLALLNGLVSDLGVTEAPDGSGTEVRMSWPVTRRPAH
jgi:anti-sigma regulatory factor (Ser/Thr protein kinase)